jgi:hypothetical protein
MVGMHVRHALPPAPSLKKLLFSLSLLRQMVDAGISVMAYEMLGDDDDTWDCYTATRGLFPELDAAGGALSSGCLVVHGGTADERARACRELHRFHDKRRVDDRPRLVLVGATEAGEALREARIDDTTVLGGDVLLGLNDLGIRRVRQITNLGPVRWRTRVDRRSATVFVA